MHSSSLFGGAIIHSCWEAGETKSPLQFSCKLLSQWISRRRRRLTDWIIDEHAYICTYFVLVPRMSSAYYYEVVRLQKKANMTSFARKKKQRDTWNITAAVLWRVSYFLPVFFDVAYLPGAYQEDTRCISAIIVSVECTWCYARVFRSTASTIYLVYFTCTVVVCLVANNTIIRSPATWP